MHLVLDGSIFPVPVSVLIGFYTVSFLLSGALVAGALWAHDHGLGRARLLFTVGAAVSWFDMLVARRKFGLDQALTDVGALVVLVVVLGVIWTLTKRTQAGGLATIRAD